MAVAESFAAYADKEMAMPKASQHTRAREWQMTKPSQHIFLLNKTLHLIFLPIFAGTISNPTKDENKQIFFQHLCMDTLRLCFRTGILPRPDHTKGTIVGNDEDGYYLFSYGGDEVAICYGKGLDKYERAYYGLSFKEENRFFSDRTPGFTIIDNASVEIETANRIIHPISKAEADKRGITHPDSCSVDKNFDLSDSYGAGDGYFDFYTLATISHDSYTHYEYASVPIDLVYDPARQSPDTLRLELCYRPRVPEGWEKYRYEGGTLSCDISGLAGLQEWNDSLCIVVETGDDELHYLPISKKDFKKPEPFFDF